jgi:hypothetical protein
MKYQVARIATLVLILGLGAGLALAQDSSSSGSLGDLARQLKAQRAKSQEKSKVYTNDDITSLPPLPGQSTAPSAKPSRTSKEAKPGEKPAKEKSGKEAEKESAKATPAQTAEETHGANYYRDHMSELQDRLEIDRRELSVLEQQLGQNQMMYYPDPNKGLLQESGPTALSDIDKLQDQILRKKVAIAADQEAIESLREQLRREGGDAEWLRSTKPTSQASEPGQAATQPEKPEEKTGTKKYWQARFKSARARLADAQERQQLAEDELNLLQIQGARALNPNAKTELAGQIKAKEDEVSQKRAATEEAQEALDDLQREFQASGAPEEWSETED